LHCDYHFSETSQTLFHDTHLEIRDWFLAIYLMGSIENGARAAQLKRYLGISHQTSVDMAELIRETVKNDKDLIERCVQAPQGYGVYMAPAAPNRNRHPTLHAVVYKFATEERAREHVARIRWPNGTTCPKCQKPNVRRVRSKCRRNRHLYWCLLCKKQFSVTSGSRDLHNVRKLSEWLIALYLMESTPRGVRPGQLQRLLGISYRTAVSLLARFRGRKERRKRLFDIYIGHNDPAEFKKAQEAIKKERRLIQEYKAK
jgi:transposase-like protein